VPARFAVSCLIKIPKGSPARSATGSKNITVLKSSARDQAPPLFTLADCSPTGCIAIAESAGRIPRRYLEQLCVHTAEIAVLANQVWGAVASFGNGASLPGRDGANATSSGPLSNFAKPVRRDEAEFLPFFTIRERWNG
jgi:hypothetical protein